MLPKRRRRRTMHRASLKDTSENYKDFFYLVNMRRPELLSGTLDRILVERRASELWKDDAKKGKRVCTSLTCCDSDMSGC